MSQLSLVSIIVPIYNMDKYLEQCIQSLVKQTYSNIEIILINDGSTDQSYHILEKWKTFEERITVVHCENHGVSKARNEGIRITKGEYITFVDADDFIDETTVEKMVLRLEEFDAEMVFCQIYNYFNENEIKEFALNVQINRTSNIYINKKLMKNIHCGVWAKLLKKNIIEQHSIYFSDTLRIGEDLEFIVRYMFYCKKIAHVQENLYYYRRRLDSTVQNKLLWIDVFQALSKILDFFKDKKAFNLFRKQLSELCERYIIMSLGIIKEGFDEKEQAPKYRQIEQFAIDFIENYFG